MTRVLMLLVVAGCSQTSSTSSSSSSSGGASDAAVGVPDCTVPFALDGVPAGLVTRVAQDLPTLLCNPEPGDYFLVEFRSYVGPSGQPSSAPSTMKVGLRISPDGTMLSKSQDADGGVLVYGGTWTVNGFVMYFNFVCPSEVHADHICGYVDGGFLLGRFNSDEVEVYTR